MAWNLVSIYSSNICIPWELHYFTLTHIILQLSSFAYSTKLTLHTLHRSTQLLFWVSHWRHHLQTKASLSQTCHHLPSAIPAFKSTLIHISHHSVHTIQMCIKQPRRQQTTLTLSNISWKPLTHFHFCPDTRTSSRTDSWVHIQQNAGLRLFVHPWSVHDVDDY